MTARLGVLAVVLTLAASPALWAEEPQPSSTLAAARAAYERRADRAQAAAAVDLFRKAAAEDAGSYEARWEGAKAVYFLGAFVRVEELDSSVVSLFESGIALAKQAVELRPKGVEGHFWLGVLYGVYGEAKGIFKSLSLVPLIKQEMQTCLDLDPSVEGWGPDRTLGRVYFKLPGFKGGDNAKSIQHLERSLAGAPTNALTRLYLAETLRDERKKARALELVRSILEMTPDPRWAAEHPTIRARAEKLQKKLT